MNSFHLQRYRQMQPKRQVVKQNRKAILKLVIQSFSLLPGLGTGRKQHELLQPSLAD